MFLQLQTEQLNKIVDICCFCLQLREIRVYKTAII